MVVRGHVRRIRRSCVAAALALSASACSMGGLSFVQDDSVTIRTPDENDAVSLPFTLSWTAENHDSSFAVFFDRPPMRPDQTLQSLVPDGDPCRTAPGCPDAAWLAGRDVYVTDAESVEIVQLTDRRESARAKDRHDVTVVLLDEDGRRDGESAATRELIVERDR